MGEIVSLMATGRLSPLAAVTPPPRMETHPVGSLDAIGRLGALMFQIAALDADDAPEGPAWLDALGEQLMDIKDDALAELPEDARALFWRCIASIGRNYGADLP